MAPEAILRSWKIEWKKKTYSQIEKVEFPKDRHLVFQFNLRAMFQIFFSFNLFHRFPFDGPFMIRPLGQFFDPGRRFTSCDDSWSVDRIQMCNVSPILRNVFDVTWNLQWKEKNFKRVLISSDRSTYITDLQFTWRLRVSN